MRLPYYGRMLVLKAVADPAVEIVEDTPITHRLLARNGNCPRHLVPFFLVIPRYSFLLASFNRDVKHASDTKPGVQPMSLEICPKL